MKKRILLVEDDVVIAMSKKKELEPCGYHVITAPSEKKMMATVRQDNAIDLVLMDVDLGKEAAASIMQEYHTPVLILCSHIDKKTLKKIEAITPYGYVTKSSDISVLDASIKMALKLFEANDNAEQQTLQFSTTLESIDNAVIITDPQGHIKRMNPVAETLTGWTWEQAAGKPLATVFKVIDAETGKQTGNPLGNVLDSGKPAEISTNSILVAKEGMEFRISQSVSPVLGNDGRVLGGVLVFHDMTEHLRSQVQLQTIFEMSMDMICIADYQSATFLKVNPAFMHVLGYKEEELLDRPFFEFVHPDDLKATTNIIEQNLKKGKKIHRFINRYRTKQGEYRWLDWNSHPMPEKGVTYAIAHDVTEQKLSEDAMRDSENKMRSIFRVAPTGIGVVKDRILLEVNPMVCEMVDRDESELIGKCARILYQSDEEFDYVGVEKYRQISEYGTGTVETRWQKKDGSIIDVILSSTPIAAGDLSRGSIFTARDITKRKKNEAKIHNLLKEKELLLKEVHHRIKNNMIVMKGLLALQAEKIDEPVAKEALESAKNRMTSMMLLYDKIYRNEIKEKISIKDYLSSLVDEIIYTYPIRVNVQKKIPDIMIPVHIASPLGIIINELISNAMKYAYSDMADNTIEIRIADKQGHLIITVQDNGKGFDVAKTPKGFGLELVGNLVDQIGGSFNLEQDRGTRCVLEFEI